MSEIKKIEHIGTTGGIDGDYSYPFSDNQIVEFIDLLNQVELGGKVDENKASSNGAVSYYTIYFVIDETLTIIPLLQRDNRLSHGGGGWRGQTTEERDSS